MGHKNSKARSFLHDLDLDVGLTARQLKKIWNKYDKDRDGSLNREEFCVFFHDYAVANKLPDADKLANVFFDRFDVNKDGILGYDELSLHRDAKIAEFEQAERARVASAVRDEEETEELTLTPLVAEENAFVKAGAQQGGGPDGDKIMLIHFNDIYNIQSRGEKPGGAARFTHYLKSLAEQYPLVFFSGDAFSPSTMSTAMHGKQMVPCMNEMLINTACFGNHDFDFGVEELVELVSGCNFPWLMSNCYDQITGEPLAGGEVQRVITWAGHKIGLIGLVEREWLVTLATITPEEIDFRDPVTEGRKLARELKKEHGVEMVIALTHMRMPNDYRVAEEVDEIDLILGGHDHHYEATLVNGTYVINSGTDFRECSRIEVTFEDGKPVVHAPERVAIDPSMPDDPTVAKIVAKYNSELSSKLEVKIGYTDVELDGKFCNIRTKETNLGNLVCDIMRGAMDADCALLNSGTLRSDCIHPKGPLKMADLTAILPMPDALVILGITGSQLITALENGVSQYPRLEGRFPQVSGITFAFDPNKEPGSRVVEGSVCVDDKPLVLDKQYKLVTKEYLARGKDGYDVYKDCEVLVDSENCSVLPALILNHFTALRVDSGQRKRRALSVKKNARVMRSGSLMNIVPAKEQPNMKAICPQCEDRIRCVPVE